MITKLQKICIFVFILFNIFDFFLTVYAIYVKGGQEWGFLLRHFSSDPLVFILVMIFVKSLAVYCFYKMIVLCNRNDPDHPEISWSAAGNCVAAGVLSIFPVWMVIMAFLNLKG